MTTDEKPLGQLAAPIAAFDRPQLIEGYISLNIRGWQASFGKQSLWMGPTMDPFSNTNNAPPLYMFRLDQTSPTKLPGFLSWLGPYKFQIYFGELTGQHYDVNGTTEQVVFSIGRSLAKQPMEYMGKVSFHPTPNFQFGVSVSTTWGGPGIPITFSAVRHTLTDLNNPTGPNPGIDPGDRRAYFDFSYRIPFVRKYLTVYDDSFSEDAISPLCCPRRSAHDAGLYVSQIPKLSKLDFRFEGGFTDPPNFRQPSGGGFFYWNVGYLDGYTNRGNIISNATMGRQGLPFAPPALTGSLLTRLSRWAIATSMLTKVL